MYSIDGFERLLSTANLSREEKDDILERLYVIIDNDDEFSLSECKDIMISLLNNQLDPVTSGMNYNQTDIIKHLRQLR